LQYQTEVVDAIRTGDGHAAARLARQNLYDYYAGYVPEPDRDSVRALIDET
jgi:DNA-binding GntR family transcriptional regulator